jgi:hypothetical protein
MSSREPVYTFQRPRPSTNKNSPKLYGSDVTTSTVGLSNGNSIETYQGESNKTALDYIKDTAYYQKWTLYIVILILAMLIICIVCVNVKGLPVKIKG